MINSDLLKYYFNRCREEGFPLDIYSTETLKKDFEEIKRIGADHLVINNKGLKIIYHFHPSIWKANKYKFKSPYEAWQDDILLIQCIKNRLKYKGAKLSPNQIRSGFSIAQLAPKVSIFRPSIAKYLIQKYLNEYNQIFDPCSGYSGRLLAANVLNKEYIGQDINYLTLKEANNLISTLNLKNIKMHYANSIYSTGEYECLFTCPPYGNKENWNQSIEELSCDDWIDICLANFKCKCYLFVVGSTEKYKEYIVEKIKNTSHFNTNFEYVVLIKK